MPQSGQAALLWQKSVVGEHVYLLRSQHTCRRSSKPGMARQRAGRAVSSGVAAEADSEDARSKYILEAGWQHVHTW